MTPLLFAAWEHLEPSDFVRTIKLVCAITFRYTIVAGLNPNELEWAYHDAAKAVIDGSAKTPRQVFEVLRPIYVADSRFRVGFADMILSTSGHGRHLAKYILAMLESDARQAPIDWETDPATIEHILPENPSVEWEQSVAERDWDEAIYRLGNLTLLEASSNRGIADKPYDLKLEAYKNSVYVITKSIPNDFPESWSMAIIAERQNMLASRAVHIWRSDFDDDN
jgi:hypothetical protein